MARLLCSSLCLFCTLLMVGCGEDTGTVKGKVTFNGQPVTVGSIAFTLTDGSKTYGAEIKSGGSFEFDNPLVVGKYKVDYQFPELDEEKTTAATKILEHCLVPEDFQADVKSGDNDIPIQLQFKRPGGGGADDV